MNQRENLDPDVWGPTHLDREAKPCPPGKCRRETDTWPAGSATELDLKRSTCQFCGWSTWSVSVRLRLQYGPAVQLFEDFIRSGRFSAADPAGVAWKAESFLLADGSSTTVIQAVKLDGIPDACIYDAPVHRLAHLPPVPPGARLDDDTFDGHTMIDPPFMHLPRTGGADFQEGHTIVGAPLVHLPYRPANPVEQLEYIDTDPAPNEDRGSRPPQPARSPSRAAPRDIDRAPRHDRRRAKERP